MRPAVAAILAVLLPAAGAPAGPAEASLSLDEAVAVALENSYRLGIAGTEVGVAEARAREAYAALLPRVEVSETLQRTTNPVAVFGHLLGQEAFGPENFDTAFLNEPDALTNASTRLALSQPLWAGGRIRAGLTAARLSADAARSGRERTRQEVVHEVVDAWTGAVLADRSLVLARDALETARAHVALVADLHGAGLVVESDLLQARVRESEREEQVVRAESDRAVAGARLNLALGRDLSTPLLLPRALAVAERAEEPLEGLETAALRDRPDLEAARREVEAAERRIEAARAGFRPEIGLTGLYEANAEDLPGADGTNWGVLVSARFVAFDGRATAARVRQARLGRELAARQATLLEESAALELRRAWHGLRSARRRLEPTRRAVELARESLRIVEDRYREGLATLVELLEAETALTGARLRELAARRDVLLASAGLDLAAGRL